MEIITRACCVQALTDDNPAVGSSGAFVGYHHQWCDERKILWLQPLSGGVRRKVADLGTEILADSSALAFSFDGKRVVLVQGGWKHDAVLIGGLK